MTRTATLTVRRTHGGDVQLGTVQRFLPGNYSARGENGIIVIQGEDVAGWTLDGYVLPRLASGGMYAKEV